MEETLSVMSDGWDRHDPAATERYLNHLSYRWLRLQDVPFDADSFFLHWVHPAGLDDSTPGNPRFRLFRGIETKASAVAVENR